MRCVIFCVQSYSKVFDKFMQSLSNRMSVISDTNETLLKVSINFDYKPLDFDRFKNRTVAYFEYIKVSTNVSCIFNFFAIL